MSENETKGFQSGMEWTVYNKLAGKYGDKRLESVITRCKRNIGYFAAMDAETKDLISLVPVDELEVMTVNGTWMKNHHYVEFNAGRTFRLNEKWQPPKEPEESEVEKRIINARFDIEEALGKAHLEQVTNKLKEELELLGSAYQALCKSLCRSKKPEELHGLEYLESLADKCGGLVIMTHKGRVLMHDKGRWCIRGKGGWSKLGTGAAMGLIDSYAIMASNSTIIWPEVK